MVDRDLVLRRLALLDTYLEQLTPYRQIDLDEYRQDWKTQRIIERTLHLAVETCMDLADHLVADRRLRVPETGAESFEVLAEAQLLPRELAAKLAAMDPTIVIRVLRQDLGDLDRFRDLMRALV